ncbi:MAG: hypothetical protein A2Z12_01710 [Actinobacteria bacterium RBG_16_68_21]|nr:MAG: hypothetical protein A2Z12_01710 [Actinobacteria bacterium RBG_16_68_21]
MPAIIGITMGLRRIDTGEGETSGYAIRPTYLRMVEAVGAGPVLLPPVAGEAIPALLDRLDALILSGGGDVAPDRYRGTPHPTVYGVDSARDEFEIALARAAADRRLPTLCICRGIQVMNVAFGGTLIEDIPYRAPGALNHNVDGDGAYHPQHPVTISPGSSTAGVLGVTGLEVNSIHHQAVDLLGAGLIATAHAPDGIVEALEPTDLAWPMWAVQWHPEYLGPSDEPSLRLFAALATAAGE